MGLAWYLEQVGHTCLLYTAAWWLRCCRCIMSKSVACVSNCCCEISVQLLYAERCTLA
jgi:hypothetical protein